MSIGQVLMILWRRGWVTVLTFLSTLAVAFGVLLFVPGRYDAIATATLDPGGASPVNGAMDRSRLLWLRATCSSLSRASGWRSMWSNASI